jgi:NAD+ synthase
MKTTNWEDVIGLADPRAELASMTAGLGEWCEQRRRRGAVVGVSGGVDSAVTLALAARALGPDRALAVLLPDRDSDPDSVALGEALAERLGVTAVVHDVTPTLEAFGAYSARDRAAADVFPDYDPGRDRIRVEYRPDFESSAAIARFCLTRIDADGASETRYMRPDPYLRIVAATNLKQRTRMAMLYLEAESRNWAVVGTSNRLEVEQGFFVKHGDGAADVFPLGHLYKSQVYELAALLDVPKEIVARAPTTDTYSAEQTQEEFFYGLPVRETDVMWAAYCDGASPAEVSTGTGMDESAVARLHESFRRRAWLAGQLREAPISVGG